MGQYVIAIYIRLSLEDKNLCENGKDESNSVTNQRQLIHRYIKASHQLCDSEVVEFLDDGHTGLNFDRPALKKMLERVNLGSVNCIIVKDFSRFARDHIEVGYYMEQYFPLLGIRFISVNDRYDSVDYIGTTPDISFGFLTLIHELYSNDLSQKIRSARKTKAKMGKYINQYAPYGYKKSIQDKNKLEVDENAAKIVKRIFQMRLDGKKIKEIAKSLNYEGIPTPGQYKVMKGSKRKWSEHTFWDASNIGLILRDERYIGNCVFGKKERDELGKASTKSIPRSEWIIVKGMHEAIVEEDDFAKVQKMFRKSPKIKQKLKVKCHLSGKIKCGGCHHSLDISGGNNQGFFCKTPYFCNDRNCLKGKLSVREIEAVILLLLQTQIRVIAYFSKQQINQKQKCVSYVRADLKSLEMAIEKHRYDRLKFYELFKEGKITEQKYEEKRVLLNRDISRLKGEVENIKNQDIEDSKIIEHSFCIFENTKRYPDLSELTKELVETFIGSIYVFDHDKIEIIWNFNDIMESQPTINLF